jgi:raffinose/stachyose/melibiose transport system permease protein
MAASTPAIKPRNRLNLRPLVWIAPAVAMLATFLFFPIGYTSLLSFFEWNGFTPNAFEKFVGLGNYAQATQDEFFITSFRNTLMFVGALITVELFIAFSLAVFIFLARFRGAAWLRGVIFFPSVLSAVVVGIIWRNVVFLREGLIDVVTTTLGLPGFYPLGDIKLAFYMIILVGIWQNVGFNLVIFYAGLQSLDHEVLEAAQMDGASFWQTILRVIAPLQTHVILVNVILNVIGGVKIFDLVFSLSNSKGRGPLQVAHITDVFATYMHFNSFGGALAGGNRRLGYAAAIAVVMMIVMLTFAVFRQRLRKTFDI